MEAVAGVVILWVTEGALYLGGERLQGRQTS